MFYYPIVLVGSIALVVQYVFATDAAVWSKWLVAGILVYCLAGGFGFFHLGLPGLLLQVGLSVFVALYLMCASARR
jgi:hypothetical protein